MASAPSRATPRLALVVVGDDLNQLQAFDRQYEAMWREWGSLDEHDPTFLKAKSAYDAAEHQLAEAVHQMLKREARPSLTLVEEYCVDHDCACGNAKRKDAPMCNECADLCGALNHDDDTRDAMPAGDL